MCFFLKCVCCRYVVSALFTSISHLRELELYRTQRSSERCCSQSDRNDRAESAQKNHSRTVLWPFPFYLLLPRRFAQIPWHSCSLLPRRLIRRGLVNRSCPSWPATTNPPKIHPGLPHSTPSHTTRPHLTPPQLTPHYPSAPHPTPNHFTPNHP